MISRPIYAGAGVVAVTLAIALSGCGSSDTKTDAATPSVSEAAAAVSAAASAAAGATTDHKMGGATLAISADPSGALAFEQKSLTASAGKTMIVFTNKSSVPHNVQIEPADSEGDVGGTDTITASKTMTTIEDLKPGTYNFYCNIPGHEDAGMKGTLTVN